MALSTRWTTCRQPPKPSERRHPAGDHVVKRSNPRRGSTDESRPEAISKHLTARRVPALMP